MKYRYLCYLGTSVTLLCLLAACAPAPPHLDAEEMPMDPDLGALPAATGILPRPDPRPGFDCNDNGIEDAFDIAGLIPHGPYAVGHNPFYLTASDLDNNGAADIAVSNLADGTVTIWWQHHRERRFDRSSTIHLNQPPANEAPPHPTCIAAGDIDGNGYNDLVVAPNDGRHPYVILLKNNGSRQFDLQTLQTPEAWRTFPKCVTVADIDNDENLDVLAVSGQEAPTYTGSTEHIVLFRNLGEGVFTSESREVFETDIRKTWDVIATDLNSDNDHPEVIFKGQWKIGVLTNEASNYRSLDDWTFTYYSYYNHQLAALAAADIISDSGIDLVVLQTNGSVNLMRNQNGRISAENANTYGDCEPEEDEDCISVPAEFGEYYGQIGTGDINNDGDIDILIPDSANDRVVLLHNRDNQYLLEPQYLPVSEEPMGIYVGNLDADNRLEIVVSNVGTDDVWVLHRRPEPVSRDRNGNGVPDSCEPPPGFGDTTP